MALCILSTRFTAPRFTVFPASKVILFTLAIILVAASMGNAANPLKNTEIASGIYGAWGLASLQQVRDIPLTILSHPNVESIVLAHSLGTRVLTYCTFYQAPPNMLYQNTIIDDHPDWICIQPDGSFGKSVFNGTDEEGWVTTCPNSPGYRDYVLKYVKYLMDQGADGLFIDNAHPDLVCEAPVFNIHQHIYPNEDNNFAYRKLLEDVRALVKTYGEDKAVVVNPGNPQEEWVGACDGQMLESYICSWSWNNRWAEDKILGYQKKWSSISESESPVIALSYLGHTKNRVRDDAFYTYAWAKLSGFIWADWFTGKSSASDLYRVRIGQPTGPMQTLNGYYKREYTGGMVVATSQSKGASFTIDAVAHPAVTDAYTGKLLRSNRSGYYEITLKSGEGRVYTYAPEVRVAATQRTKMGRGSTAHRFK